MSQKSLKTTEFSNVENLVKQEVEKNKGNLSLSRKNLYNNFALTRETFNSILRVLIKEKKLTLELFN